ncbi:MAG: Uma2 family endonuclease [Phaeodactylibacter sp.]|nr:Uma2 family endonuclease [Phaeodactylibacter sp.]
METAVEKRYTLEEYLKMEYHAKTRHYFYNGKVAPMPYASDSHGSIVANLMREIGVHVKKTTFRVYPSDRMLYVPECRLNYYPDVMVVKGEPVFHRHTKKMFASLNPYVLIEVLSDSTEEDGRIDKWQCYRKISGLQQYFMVARDRVYIDFYNRIDETRWENSYVDQMDQEVEIAGFRVKVEDIYLNVALEKPEKKADL